MVRASLLVAVALVAAGQGQGQGQARGQRQGQTGRPEPQPKTPAQCLPFPQAPLELDRGFPLEMVPQVGHVEEVYAIAFAPSGRLVATGSRDRTVKLWSI